MGAAVATHLKPRTPEPVYVLVNVEDYKTDLVKILKDVDKDAAIAYARNWSKPFGRRNEELYATHPQHMIYWNQQDEGDASNHVALFEAKPEA